MSITKNIEAISSVAKKVSPSGQLHAPWITKLEKKYVNQALKLNEISSIGFFVKKFKDALEEYFNLYAVPLVNGTCALELALRKCGAGPGDKVLTSSVTFIATANAIHNVGAEPVFYDADDNLDPIIENNNYKFYLPVHILGFLADIKEDEFKGSNIIEDACQTFGSSFKLKGDMAILSFNGNKTITTGGGGAILTKSKSTAGNLEYLSTQAKMPFKGESIHTNNGHNFRMTNLPAAIGCGQIERISEIMERKEENFRWYKKVFDELGVAYIYHEDWNYWMIAMLANDLEEKYKYLQGFYDRGIMARSLWEPLPLSIPYEQKMKTDNFNKWYDRLIMLPSGAGRI